MNLALNNPYSIKQRNRNQTFLSQFLFFLSLLSLSMSEAVKQVLFSWAFLLDFELFERKEILDSYCILWNLVKIIISYIMILVSFLYLPVSVMSFDDT